MKLTPTLLAVAGIALGQALALPAMAQEASETAPQTGEIATAPEPSLRLIAADDVTLDEYLWTSRVLVVFAQTERDPRFQEQLDALFEDPEALITRDLVVIVDHDPEARSSIRARLRPRGFMLAIIEKDGQVMSRKPSPRTTREIAAIVDRFPMRRQEMLERRPAGR